MIEAHKKKVKMMVPGIWAGGTGTGWWGLSGWAVAFLIGFIVVFFIAAVYSAYLPRY
jgi:hypothetical protein